VRHGHGLYRYPPFQTLNRMDLNSLILESTPHCVLVLDGEFRLVYANRNFHRFTADNFGVELKVGDLVVKAFPEPKRLRYKLRLEEALSGQCARSEESFEINGFLRYFDVSYHPVGEEGDWDKVSICFEEITSRKRKEIRWSEEENHLKELLATRETLLSIISHDLRSPIFQLNGLLFLIRQTAGSRDEARLQMQAEDLEERISHLTHTIDNLLGWSNLQRQNLEPRVSLFSLESVFEHAIGLLKPVAQRKAVRIYTKQLRDLELYSDREMVAFIARNLINNAIKFSVEGGKIEVFAEKLDNAITFTVQDHGVGIGEERMATLREGSRMFTQTGTWGEQGTGLGLKLCYEFVDRLEGSMRIDSTKGSGTEVTVYLPQLDHA